MTYADELAELGAEVDTKIASITGQPVGHGHEDAAVALGTAFDADLAAAKPPFRIEFGISYPGYPEFDGRIRTYEGGVPTSFAGSQAGHVKGRTLHASMKAAPGTLKSSASTRAATLAWLKGVPDDSDVTNQHEPENPSKGNDPVKYLADQPVFLDLVDEANIGRAKPLHPIQVFMAYSLDPAVRSVRNIAGKWLCTDPRFKVIGFDAYRTAVLQLAHDFAVAHGLDWIIPEYGFAVVGGTKPDDHTYAVRIAGDVKLLRAMPHPPLRILLWDQGIDALDGDPEATALWAALIAGAA